MEPDEAPDSFDTLVTSISVSLPLGVLREVDHLLNQTNKEMRRQGRKSISRSKLITQMLLKGIHGDQSAPTETQTTD